MLHLVALRDCFYSTRTTGQAEHVKKLHNLITGNNVSWQRGVAQAYAAGYACHMSPEKDWCNVDMSAQRVPVAAVLTWCRNGSVLLTLGEWAVRNYDIWGSCLLFECSVLSYARKASYAFPPAWC